MNESSVHERNVAASDRLLIVLVSLLVAIPTIGAIDSSRFAVPSPTARPHALLAASPTDPLLGSTVHGIPRYDVAHGELSTVRPASSLYGGAGWLAYNPFDRAFWVAVLPNFVDVVNESGNVLAQFPVGSDPFGVAVNPWSNLVYVTNTGSDNVTVLNGTYTCTNSSDPSSCSTQEHSIPVGSAPLGIAVGYEAFDGTDLVYVANSGSNNVTVFNGTWLARVGDVPVGAEPRGIAFDPSSRSFYVADGGDNAVSVLSLWNNCPTCDVVRTIPVGLGPYGVAVDNGTNTPYGRDTIYVTNQNSSNVSVISTNNDWVIGSIPSLARADLQGIAYDGTRDELWVGEGVRAIGVINASAGEFAYELSLDPSGVAYDPNNGTVCLTMATNFTFECLSSPHGFDRTAAVAVHESGLPAGQAWSVYIPDGAALTSTSAYANFSVYPMWPGGNWSYLVDLRFAPSGDYVPSVMTATFPANNSGPSPATYNVTFVQGTAYPIFLNETGLTIAPMWSSPDSSTGWGVDVAGRVVTTVENSTGLWMPNGTYAFSVLAPYGEPPNPVAGNVTVAGAPAYVSIAFGNSTSTNYAVPFTESGLPTGVNWTVVFTAGPTQPRSWFNSTSGSFELPNGSYSFVASASDPNYTAGPGRSFSEHGGFIAPAAATDLNFTLRNGTNGTYYPVRFNVTGLTAGSIWNVTLGNTTSVGYATGSSSSIVFYVPNGTYPCEVGVPSGFVFQRGPPGNVTVSGTAVLVDLHGSFPSGPHALTFQERGLAQGTGWAVAIGSAVESSLGSNLTFVVDNGAYGYVVLAVSGYSSPTGGVATVNGTDVVVNITFAVVTYPIVIVEFGLAANITWTATVSNLSRNVSETEHTNASVLIFYLPNGTYSVQVTAPGYTANLSAPTFTVSGAGTTGATARFAPPPACSGPCGNVPGSPPPSAPGLGLSLAGLPVYGWLAILGVATVGVVAMLLQRRRRGTA